MEPGDLGGDRIPQLINSPSDASTTPTTPTTSTNLDTDNVSQVAIGQDLAGDSTINAIPERSSGSPRFSSHNTQVLSSHPEVLVTTSLDSKAVSQVATHQDLVEKPTSDATPISKSGQPRFDLHDLPNPGSQPGNVVTIDGLTAASLSPGEIFRFAASSRVDRRTSRLGSLPSNFTRLGKATSIRNNPYSTMVLRPRIVPNPAFQRPSNPFQNLLRDLLGKEVTKPGERPGSSVVGDCVVSWKPSVVPQLFEFKYWFKQFKKKCVFLVQDYHLRQESPVSSRPRVLAEHNAYILAARRRRKAS